MLQILRKRMAIIFVLLFIICFPDALTKEALSSTNAIVIAFGIDKIEEEYEITFQVVVPKQNNVFKKSLAIVSAKDKDPFNALEKVETHIGNKVAFKHCQYVVLNDEAVKEDISILLDFLIRNKEVANSCVLVNTDKSAKDLLTLDVLIEENLNFDLTRMLNYNETHKFAYNSNLEDFYTGYFSKRKCSLMPYITITEEDSEGVSADAGPSGGSGTGGSGESSGGSGGSSSGDSSEPKKKNLSNTGQMALIKEGKKFDILSVEDLFSLDWYKNKTKKGRIIVENITDNVFTNATVGLKIINKKAKIKTSFEEDTPVFELKVKCKMRVVDIKNAFEEIELLKSDTTYMTPVLKARIEEKIKQQVLSVFSKMKEKKCDVANIYSYFDKYNYPKFRDYLQSLNEGEYYLDRLKLVVEVEVST